MVAVYVFGGYLHRFASLNSAEVFDFREGKWTELPSMLAIEGYVKLCSYLSHIYLLGYNQVAERFTVQTNTYTSLTLQQPEAGLAAGVLVYNNQLCSFQQSSYRQWDLLTGKLTGQSKNTSTSFYTHHPSILVRDNLAYIEYERYTLARCLQVLDLDSGRVVREAALQYAEN